ncbi:AMP-binding protein [Acidiplasma cupricumulans]|uniref:AMP-binding protein n=1 Tax=Acidiplasma cupricumulans TaxID=312540 RepID=UPI000780D6F0|nr:AMP-binding protein [Acidiplasma cupricumulans]
MQKNVFKNSTGTALIYKNEMNETKTMSYEELKMKTGALYNFLRVNGIKSGDVIATYLSNTTENIISFLASASLGCIFSSISIDFGSRGAMERLMQLSPKVLIVTEKYYYGGREYEKTRDINEILKNIQTIKLVITVNSINKKYTWIMIMYGILTIYLRIIWEN